MKWSVLIVLAVAQFLMVLDQAVMNVAISQLVADFDTTVTTIQTVIALYALVMAALMVTGAKLGDVWGRKKVFAIGLVIYASGSALTAASWSVPTLMLGWSVLEGIGAAMVLPALVALVAGNYAGPQRAIAFGVLGGVAGAGIAVGPILGGWATTELSWRVVFVGEVVVAALILFGTRYLREPEREGSPPRLDWVGSVLAALGMATVVIGVLQASNWGWLRPLNSPAEPFGFSLTPFVIAAGLLVLAGFRAWERRREQQGSDPLIHFRLLEIIRFRGALSMLLAQNLILMGVFFTVPLYLQVVQGLDALETGVRMLPASVGLFIAALGGSALSSRFAPRPLVRAGLVVTFLSTLMLLGVIEPELDNASFLLAMGVLGIGMGLVISQLGNVAQSSVTDGDRSEAGGLQNTAQQLAHRSARRARRRRHHRPDHRLYEQHRLRSAGLSCGPAAGRDDDRQRGQLHFRGRGPGGGNRRRRPVRGGRRPRRGLRGRPAQRLEDRLPVCGIHSRRLVLGRAPHPGRTTRGVARRTRHPRLANGRCCPAWPT